MTPQPDSFGPWAPSLSPMERRCRWRALAALAMVYVGGRHPLMRLCLAAEHDVALAEPAWRSIEGLAPLPYRRLLAAYAALSSLARVIAPTQEAAPTWDKGWWIQPVTSPAP